MIDKDACCIKRDALIHSFSTLQESKSLVTEFDLGQPCLTGSRIHENGDIRIWNPLQ